ncbi:hypothetical protein D3C86_1832580 [compost metagenome]
MADELAEQDVPTPQRVGQQQQQRAAFVFADDGVIGQQQSNQRHAECRQAGEASDGGGHRGEAQLPGSRRPQPGDAGRQHREQQADRQQPAVAQTVIEFLAGHVPDRVHTVSPLGVAPARPM